MTVAHRLPCRILIDGRPGRCDGMLQCTLDEGHTQPHRFIAPDGTLRWWPVELGPFPTWGEAISTPATDLRWPDVDCCWIGDPCPIHNPSGGSYA